jgi:hypothetical protein
MNTLNMIVRARGAHRLETMGKERILRNAAKCRLCGDVIESKHVHDFVRCKCGEIFVDGGREYIRRGAKTFANIIDLSESVSEESIHKGD